MPKRITETLVKNLALPSGHQEIVYDTDLKGFGVRVTSGGSKSFILNYRVHGRERRFTIGSYPDWSAAAARKEAESLKRQIDVGHDPMSQRREDRAAPTVADLCRLYEERHLPKKRPSSQRDDLATIRGIILPRFGREKAASVRHRDIEMLHHELSKQAPYRANRVVALLSKMYSLAMKWEMVEENPATKIERNPENRRNRYLTPVELDRLNSVLDAYRDQSVANAIRLMLLTGARRNEVLAARWEQFDLEHGSWVKPAAFVKQAREHRIPLSRAACDLLLQMRGSRSGPLLFPGAIPGRPIRDMKKAWASIRRQAELHDLRLHDLRHSFASLLASSGSSLPVIGALLGHTQAQTTQRYAHLLDDPLRAAADKAGVMLTASGKFNRRFGGKGD